MKILGLDVGDTRIGVAITDPKATIAQPFEVIDRKKTKALNKLREIILENNIKTVVVGMPYSLDGTKKIQAEKVEHFILKLKNKMENKIYIETMDERFSTVMAEDILIKGGKKGALNKRKVVDKVAASIILENYLKKQKFNKCMEEKAR